VLATGGRRRANTAGMSDIVFVLLTLAAFGLIAAIGKAVEKL
jgi:hypothetical protein